MHAVVVYKDILYGESIWKWNQPPPELYNASSSSVIGNKQDIMLTESHQTAGFMSPSQHNDVDINVN